MPAASALGIRSLVLVQRPARGRRFGYGWRIKRWEWPMADNMWQAEAAVVPVGKRALLNPKRS